LFGLYEARKAFGSSGKFPISAHVCSAIPVAGLDKIATVRVMMGLLWARDSLPASPGTRVYSIGLADLRCAAGFGDSGPYRQVVQGLDAAANAEMMTDDGGVFSIFNGISVTDDEIGRFVSFRTSEAFDYYQDRLSADGYGMVDMDEVVRLVRSVDLSIYLRACAVRKRRKKAFSLSRAEIYCLSNRDPGEPISGAVRAIRTAAERVGKILKTNVSVSSIDGRGRERVRGLTFELDASEEVQIDLAAA